MKLFVLATAALCFATAANAQTSQQKAASPTNNEASKIGGGYAPSAPLFSGGTPTPGSTVVFVPNPQTPSEAFPPPPPKAEYPICKRGQFDGCRQRGG